MGVAGNLETALEAAVRRFDGTSPVTPQVYHHLGFGAQTSGPHPRLRMQLVLEVVAEEGGRIAEGLDVASAVEILHNATVVHDMTDGGAWARYGLAHGINAGDALCALAYLQLLEGPSPSTPELTVLMTRALQEANFALCTGQAQEIAFERGETADDDAYIATIAGKAALFAVACELGALVSGAPLERAQAYARLGRTCGMAVLMETDVQTDPESRTWTLPPVASAATARTYRTDADELAASAGIDAGGRIRGFFATLLRPAA